MPGNELIAEERSGPDGLVDLGLVSPGKYQLAMTAPWGEIARKSLIVAPASEQVIEIACPPAPLETSSVAVSAELPQDVREKKVRVAFQLVQDTRTFEGTEWGTTFNGQMLQGQHLDLLFFPGGEVAVREASGRFTQSFTGGTQKRSPAASSAKLAVSDYYLEGIAICRAPSETWHRHSRSAARRLRPDCRSSDCDRRLLRLGGARLSAILLACRTGAVSEIRSRAEQAQRMADRHPRRAAAERSRKARPAEARGIAGGRTGDVEQGGYDAARPLEWTWSSVMSSKSSTL